MVPQLSTVFYSNWGQTPSNVVAEIRFVLPSRNQTFGNAVDQGSASESVLGKWNSAPKNGICILCSPTPLTHANINCTSPSSAFRSPQSAACISQGEWGQGQDHCEGFWWADKTLNALVSSELDFPKVFLGTKIIFVLSLTVKLGRMFMELYGQARLLCLSALSLTSSPQILKCNDWCKIE